MKVDLNKAFPFLGIRGKLLVAFVGLAAGPFAVMGIYTVYSMSHALTGINAEHLRLQLQSNVGHIESYLAQLDANAQTLAHWVQESGVFEDAKISAEGRSLVEPFFYHFASVRPDYYQTRLFSERGFERVRIDRNGERLKSVPEAELQDKSDRYYFKDAMAGPAGRTYFSPIDLNIERGEIEVPHELVFRVARKVYDRRGYARGLVVINVFAREILDRLKLLRPKPRGDVLFIGEQGQFVREDCSSGDCEYTLGQARQYLADFPSPIVESLVAGGTAAMAEGRAQFISYGPVRVGGSAEDRRWHLAILYPKEQVLAPAQRLKGLFYLFGTLIAAVALVLTGLATRALVTPIRSILRFVEGVAVGDFRRELVVETRDEIEQLADGVRHTANALEEAQARLVRWNEGLQAEVNRKVAEVESLIEAKHAIERQVRQADRLASLGMLAASLAHEIGNPLASIKAVIQVNLRAPDMTESARSLLEAILAEVDRLAQILERTTGFVRPARDQEVVVTPRVIFRRIVFFLEREARYKSVTLQLEGEAADRPVLVEAQKLEQVLLNLMVNAVQAIEKPGTVVVCTTLRGAMLEIAVEDTGPGVPEELRGRLFDTFFTTKAGGTGLGLPIVRQLVNEMKGEIRLEFPQTGGTRARIEVPVAFPVPPLPAAHPVGVSA